MTTVRIAHAEQHFDQGPDGTTAARRILVVLADDPRRRAMGLWLPARQAMGLWQIPGRPPRDSQPPRPERHVPRGGQPVREFTAADLASRLLGAAGAAVTGVDIDELGPGVLAAQIGVLGPVGPPAGHRAPRQRPGPGRRAGGAGPGRRCTDGPAGRPGQRG
jgi:hypothetical protein